MNTGTFLWALLLCLIAGIAEASPGSLTYQGRIVKSDGKPLEYGGVSFLFDITSPDGSCVIYREQSQVKDMTNSNGVFDVPIGAGSFSVKFPQTGSFSLIDAFNNKATSFNCRGLDDATVGGTWSPSVDSIRKLRVRFWDGNGWQLVDTDMEIRSVPFSHYAQSAERAEKVGSYKAQDLLVKSQLPQSSGAPQACAAGQVLSFDGINFICVTDQMGVSGGGIQSLSGDMSSTHLLQLGSVGTSPNWIHDGSGTHTLHLPLAATNGVTAGLLSKADYEVFNSKQAALPLGGTGQVLKWNGSAWVPGAVNAFELKNSLGTTQFPTSCPVNQTLNWSAVTDAFTCNTIALSASQITSGTFSDSMISSLVIDKVTSGGGKYFSYKPSNVACTDQQVLKWNAAPARWECGVDSNAGGTVTAVSASAPLSSSGGTTPTLSISQANGSTNGYLSAADWTTFNSKLSTATTFAGDVSGSYNSLSVDKIKGKTVASNPTTSGQVLKYDGTNWTAAALKLGELVNATGGSAFNVASCTAAQTLNWSSITDKIECQNIAGLDAGVLTAGTIAAARLPSSAIFWQDGGAGKIYYSSGNVGVGTNNPRTALDVSGEVRVGNTSTGCSATNEGAMRYNSTSKLMEYCNATTWVSMAGGATKALGAWEAKSSDVVYQAATDGFVVVNPSGCSYGYYSVHSDSSNPPTVERIKGKAFTSGGSQAGATIPVRKNDYWKVTTTYSCAPDAVYWIPFN
ncbi:MAG: hypothetical protein KUL82_15010 [Bdellovibrio sp.]|nr:hypothetical protein [Bdellovibrio sp.]